MSQLEDVLQQCTVKITLRGGWGTGFFVAPDLVLTCAHVVRSAGNQPIQVSWQAIELQATVEQAIEAHDLALLRVILPRDAQSLCVYLDAEIQSRDPLYLFGYPDEGDRQGEPRTFNCDGVTGSGGILFNLGQVRPGMSGSALLNQRTGKVCGVVKFTRDRSIDLGGGAIPARVVLEQLPQLRALQQAFHQGNRRWLQCLEEIVGSAEPPIEEEKICLLQLTVDQRKDLRAALISAFPGQPQLELMIEDELGDSLNQITQGQPNYELAVRDLVKWAEASGKVQLLLEGARRSNSGNPKLQELAKLWLKT